jgi:diadenosine tetraphosphate (Ap4A) HIT family hydrolase
MKSKSDCVFCESPDIKGRTVAENALAFAFLTNIPITPGHILVSPKRCVSDFFEMSLGEKKAVLELAGEMRAVLVKSFGAEGFNFAWNDGEVGGQNVPHFHLHIVPRKAGDIGIIEYEPRKFLYRPGSREQSPELELQAVAKVIKSFMGGK